MRRIYYLIFIFIFTQQTYAQTPWSERMANAMMETHKDSITYKEEGKFARWDYEQAILLKALERVWTRTGNGKYYQFILKNMDSYVNEKGEIRTYKGEQFNIDNITGGRILLMLYRETGKEKFKLAADLLRKEPIRKDDLKGVAPFIMASVEMEILEEQSIGKGSVFALGDPWIYNEYLNGKRFPMEFENFKAAKNLTVWLLKK